MRLLVTGGAGFIGSNLVRMAVRDGHQVLNLDALTYAGNLDSLRDVEASDTYCFANVDLADAEAVSREVAEFAPQTILHLAAESHVDRSIASPNRFVMTNVVGTYHLLDASLRYFRSLAPKAASEFRFIHVSTDEVYGSLGDSGVFTETTAYAPHSPYSATKAGSDHLVRAWHDTYGLPTVVTHCSNNYGPYQFPEKLVPLVILRCLRGEPIPVFGSGENVRDWLFVEDHCRALLDVAAKGRPGESYNIGGNNEKRNIDLVHLICDLMDKLHPAEANRTLGFGTEIVRYADLITFVDDRPGHDHRYAIDASKIQRELGWLPSEDFQSGFLKTVQWYLDNRTWWQDLAVDSQR